MRQLLAVLRQSDWLLAFAVLVLMAFGLSAIYSVALSQPGSDFLLLKKQLVAAVIGGVLALALAVSNYRQLKSFSIALYVFSVILLVAVLLFGATLRGTTGWFSLPGFSFQPVELAKFALIVALAHYFGERARRDFHLRECLESGAITALPAFLTVLQPDLGSALLLVAIWFIMIMFAGVKARYIVVLLFVCAIFGLLSWNFFLVDYQKARLLTFVNPAEDPLGEGYNVTQAIIAVGSGQWFGRGLGFGSQSQLKFLPESQTDFIFAVIAEELGFFGVLLFFATFGLLFQRILRFASRTSDNFTSFLMLGIGGLFFVQFVVNVGMNLGLMPVTGISLPLVSYGGSSLVLSLVMVGILESAVARLSNRAAA